MSTTLLTLVAGELAMPRLRPLELVSRSVGREWSLLPPGASFRTELKALYAAMMRTFCMSAAAIRAMSRWDAQATLSTPSAAIPSAPTFKADTISLGMRDPVFASARRNRPLNVLSGGACAIGGAALIAWLMANHPRHPSSPTVAAAPGVTLNSAARVDDSTNRAAKERGRSDGVVRNGDAPLAWNRARGDLAARDTERTSVTSHAVDPHASGPSKHSKLSGIDHPAHDAHDARRANATHKVKREPDALAKSVRHAARETPHLTDILPRHSTPVSSVSPELHIAPGQPPRRLPSIAGAYSPAVPSARFDSDYGSVTMSAGTHISDIPPATVRHERVDTDNSDWMNHMSHRRITDAPDSFSK